MPRASSARRCSRALPRCPAITAPAIPTAMTAPITAAPRSGTGCPMLAAYMAIAKRPLAGQRRRKTDVAGGVRKASKAGGANAATAVLVAVLVAVTDGEPKSMTIANAAAQPSGPFEYTHRSLQTGLRAWVEAQTGHPLGYVEQLYTFADRSRAAATLGRRIVSISYLGLTRERATAGGHEPGWQSWYRYFPWEDWRGGTPASLARQLLPRLRHWIDAATNASAKRDRRQRVEINFAEASWNEDLVLQRYELLYEAGLVPEAGG